jgi:hypothetical protein
MIQVPEIISGILELPNIRKMPGAFGELDFQKMTNRSLFFGDSFRGMCIVYHEPY